MPSITGASRLAAILTLDIKPFLRNIEIANSRIAKFQAQAQALGSGLLRSVGLGFGLLGAGAISVAEKFSEIESQLRAIGGSTEMDPVIDTARELGRTTKFTSTEVTELALSLKKLGFDASGIQGAMTTATKLTQLFGGDLNKVGSTIAEVRRQFGLTAEEGSFERIGDVFAVAFRESALDINNLGGALKNVGTVANQSGLTLERTIALLGGLANQGQKAERAGTRLKTTLVRLGREFGFTEDQTGILTSGLLDTSEIFDLLKNRAGLAGAVIAQNGVEINLLEERLKNATGALDAMSAGLEGKLFISVAKAKAGIEDMAITLGDALAPFVEAVADGLQDLAKKFDALSPSAKESIANFAIMSVVVPIVTTLVAGLTAAVLALGGPLTLVALGLGTLAGSMVKTSLRAAKMAREQERLNKVFADFRDLTFDGGTLTDPGEGFSLDGLAQTTTGALEQLAANQEESLKDLKRQLEEAKDVQKRAQFVGVDELGFGRTTGTAKVANTLSSEQLKIQATINKLVGQQALVKRELAKREKILKDAAEERLYLQQEYSESLGFSTEILLQFQKSWEKTGDAIAAAIASFGFATEDLDQIEGKLNALADIDLTNLTERGPDQLTNLISGLKGSPEELKKLSDALAKQIQALGIEAAVDSGVDFARTFEEAAAFYRDYSKELARKIELNNIRDARNEAFNLADSLRILGRVTDKEVNEKKLSALTTELQDLLGQDIDVSSRGIVKLTEDIEKLEASIKKADLKEKLKAALEAPQTFDEFIAQTKGAEGALDAFDLQAARSGKVAKARFDDFFGGGETTFEQLQEAIQNYLAADLTAKVERSQKELREGLEKIPQDLKAIEDSLGEGFIDRSDAASQSLAVLNKEVETLTELKNLAAGDTTIFTAEDLASLTQAEIAIDNLNVKIRDMEKAANLTSFIKDQIDFLGQAFLEASQSGENFFTVLKRSFLDTFRALVAKLITLIVLFTILAIVSGGTSAASGPATQALGGTQGFTLEGLGNVLGKGFGLKNNLSVGSASTSNPLQAERSLNVTGAISGNNIVFANQRGTRAIDRTFG